MIGWLYVINVIAIMTEERWRFHIRKAFQQELLKLMQKDKNIWLLVGDLGYKMFDDHFNLFPERTINTGAAEQSMIGTAVGLALCGKLPFCYSITPFLIWRPTETIRLYVNHEKVPVVLVGSGRDKDYSEDGFSHDGTDAKGLMDLFGNIRQYYPTSKDEIPKVVREIYEKKEPTFLSLRR